MSRIHVSRIPGWTKVSKAVGWALAHQIQSLSLALRLPLRFALRLVLFAGVAVCAQLAGPAWAGVIYVRGDAAGANNGLSWADAYTDVQAALAAAEWGDEIWVAKGTYKPTTGTLRTVSFVLEAGTGLYGGFAGTENERAQRNWEANATILSGNIGTAGSAADNSYHVVTGADLAVLDGFTITGGNTDGSGGGMYNENCSPTVTNCTFSGNRADGSGGGMYNWYSSAIVTNCTFSANTAGYGGGMYNREGSPTLANCTFSGNTTDVGTGGGMYNYGGSPTVANCSFSGNTASGSGGGGGTYGSGGGGMYNFYSSPTIIGSTFSGNTATNASFGGGVGGGMYNWYSSPSVTNCAFSGNTAGSTGGGMCNEDGGWPTVTDCAFSGNTAGSQGSGGGMFNGRGWLTIANCAFSGNTAGGGGGGLYNSIGSPTVTNCTFSGNTAGNGGGMHNGSGSPALINCTFSGNTAGYGYPAGYGGGGMENNDGGSPIVINCIFWDNTAPLGAEIYNISGTPTFRHCDIKGSGGSGAWDPALGANAGGNIMGDPRFVAPATPAGPDGLWRTDDDGLRLQSDSPCIGAAFPALAPPKDILGLPRKIAPDIGAYEFASIAPTSPGADSITTTAIRWTWSDQSNNETGFKVWADPGGAAPTTLRATTAANATSWTMSALQPNTQYAFQVAATNTYADSAKTTHYTTWTLAAVPAAPTVNNPTAASLDVAVGAEDGNPVGTQYALQISPAVGGNAWVRSDGTLSAVEDWATTATWAATTVTGLAEGTVYTFTVKARNGAGVETAMGTSASAQTTDATCTLTYNAGAGGSIIGTTPQTVAYGADGAEVTAVPNTGYRFVRWSDGVMTASRTDTNVTADINVTAVFAPSKPAAVRDWPLYE